MDADSFFERVKEFGFRGYNYTRDYLDRPINSKLASRILLPVGVAGDLTSAAISTLRGGLSGAAKVPFSKIGRAGAYTAGSVGDTMVAGIKFLGNHRNTAIGVGAGLGIWAAHPMRGGHPMQYVNEALLGDPMGAHTVGLDVLSENLNRVAMRALTSNQFNAMENTPYPMVNLAGQTQDYDQFLAQMVTYRNQQTLARGPSGSLVLGMWNNRMNYF